MCVYECETFFYDTLNEMSELINEKSLVMVSCIITDIIQSEQELCYHNNKKVVIKEILQ